MHVLCWILATHLGYLLHKEPEGCKDVSQGGGGLVDLEEEEVGIQHLLHQHVLSLILQQLLLETHREERHFTLL